MRSYNWSHFSDVPKWKPENISNTIVYLLMFSGFHFGTSHQKMASVVRSHSQTENELKFLKFYNENYFRIITNSTDVTQTSYPNVLISVACLSCLKLLLVWYIVYKARLTNVTHTWYLCFLCTTRGPHTQFLMAFSNYILQFYIWYELVHSFTSSQAKDKSCYREAKNTFLPKWNIVWILCKGSPPQTPGGYLWIQHFSHYSHSHSHTLSPFNADHLTITCTLSLFL